MEAYEQKAMLEIYIKTQIHLEEVLRQNLMFSKLDVVLKKQTIASIIQR